VAFRSGHDLENLSNTDRVTYSAPPLRLTFFVNPPSGISSLQAVQAARLAVETWVAQDCAAPAISFEGSTQIEATPGDGVSTIQWVSNWDSYHLPRNAAGSTDVQYVSTASRRWEIAEADVYLNADMAWTADELPEELTTGEPKRDLQAVLTHEFGHVLGLLHPCEFDGQDGAPMCVPKDEQASMYPVYSPSQRSLSADDISGLCFLYPVAGCEQSGCPDGFECTEAGCQQVCGKSTCGRDEVCGSHGCVRGGSCSGAECSPGPCTSDKDCQLGEFCSQEQCASGSRANGDPCADFRDCQDGACLDGTCTAACSEEVACPKQAMCVTELAACRDPQKALGDICDSADDCRGGYCMQEDSRPAVCTRRCGGAEPACPEKWVCKSVEGEHICVAQLLSASGGGGCALSPPAFHSRRLAERSAFIFAHVLGATLVLARRRSRNPRSILSA
jgi:hypothetical protein